MTPYPVHSGPAKPDLNPAAMFQASPPSDMSDQGFDAALHRARQPERPAQAQGPAGAEQHRKTTSAQEPTDEPASPAPAPRAETPSRGKSGEQQTEDEARADDAEPVAETAEAPAGPPAEIAALLAALAARPAAGPTAGEPAEQADLPTVSLPAASDGRAAHRGNQQAPGQGFLFQPGRQTVFEIQTGPGARSAAPLVAEALGVGPGASSDGQTGAATTVGTGPSAQTPPPFAAMIGARVDNLRTPAQPLQLPVSTPAGSRGWSAEVGNQVVWMLGRNESKAELVLTPPSLGKLGVSIQVNGEQTTAHFVAASQAAREALEQAMPRLREVLQQAGIQLGQTNVSTSGDQPAQDGRDDSASSRSGRGGDREEPGLGPVRASDASVWTRSGDGVIDTFA